MKTTKRSSRGRGQGATRGDRRSRGLAASTSCTLLGLLAAGCGEPTADTNDDASGTSGGNVDPTTTSGDPQGTGSETFGVQTSEDSSSSTGTSLQLDVEVITYPQQPMVVDLVFPEPDLSVTAVNALDPGVRVGPIGGEAGDTRLRVRGLSPATVHSLDWNAEGPQGRAAGGQLEFTTLPPLPGFVPSFAARGDASGIEGLLLFDLVGLSKSAPASLFAVDPDGVPRWHVGQTNPALNPSIVYAAARLREDGSVIFLRDYAITALDELGEQMFSLDSETLGVPGLHHDFVPMANGNLLTMSYTFRDVDYPGRGLTYVAGDLLLEVTPQGDIVWEWDMFEHLDVNRTPTGFEDLIANPESGELAQDWTHGNGLLYDADTDSVLVSLRHQDWLIRIDRATDTIAWRFGNEGDFELTDGTWPYHQHSPQWQSDGSLAVYDNGLHNPNVEDALETSRAVRYDVDEVAMTVSQVWEDAADDFIVPIAGDVDRLDDGTLLITDSSIDFAIGASYAQIRKVDEAQPATPQWTLVTEVGTFVYRCVQIPRLVGLSGDG